MALNPNSGPDSPLPAFEFYCHDLAEDYAEGVARISLSHPEVGNLIQEESKDFPGEERISDTDYENVTHYLTIMSKRVDKASGALQPYGSYQHTPRIYQSSLVLKLSVDISLCGVKEGSKSKYYLPSWIEPFINIFSEDTSLNDSQAEGIDFDIRKIAIDKLPVAPRIHLIPVHLPPDFRAPPTDVLNLEGMDISEVAKQQLRSEPLCEGRLVVLKIMKQPFVFQITGISAIVGDYFLMDALTKVTSSVNHFDYGFKAKHGTIYKAQQQELVDLIDWAFSAKRGGGINCNSTVVLGPVGIGKSTFIKTVAGVFRCSRNEQVGVLEVDLSQAKFEASKSDDPVKHFSKWVDFQSLIGLGNHSFYLLIIYGLCTGLKDNMMLALSHSLSSLDEKCYVLLECLEKVPHFDFLQSHCVLLEPPTRFQRNSLLVDFLFHPITPAALDTLIQSTHTYAPADLKYLAACTLSIHQCSPQDLTGLMASLSIESTKPIEGWVAEQAIAETARQRKPGVVSSPPNVSFDQVGGYAKTKARLNQILLLLSQGNHRLGLRRPSGLLLVGPSGCGKTRLAHAFASHTHRTFGHHFLSVKGPSLFSQYFGGTEEAVRKLFKAARSLAPCTLFLDEIDALGPKRGWNSQDDGAGGVSARVLSTLLNELDGAQSKCDVFVVACTSFPHALDDALIRPGRFDTTILVDIPTDEDRSHIISSLISHDFASVTFDLSPSDLACIVSHTNGFTPADLAWILREAALATLENPLPHARVTLDLVLSFLEGRNPSLRKKDLAVFEKFRAKRTTSSS